MKEFDLNAALEGQPVITRDGRKVTEIHCFKSYDTDYPVHAIINNKVYSYTKEGEYRKNDEHYLDLFMAPKIIEKWVNVYQSGNEIWLNRTYHNSEESAKDVGCSTRYYLKTIKITNEL